MKHIIHQQRKDYPYLYLDIELLPANQQEQRAINSVREMNPTQEERNLVENYLLFNLNAVSIEWQRGNRILLKCSAV
ncbi:MAG: hypothetical protein BGO69_14695 [Bacteroidetes bacterium 46-16]|nr:MAG: hypothetical protein BGO69_14695 [Bacteroidetes bacterium 46-16]